MTGGLPDAPSTEPVTATRASGDQRLLDIYARLEAAYGGHHWHWYPEHAQPIDVIAGAVLVQHTTWQNAERALASLRAAGALDIAALAALPEERLAALIRASGTHNLKARRLRALGATVLAAGGLAAFLRLPHDELRARLLSTHGIGEETADAIALYAAGQPVFVIDAYTRRLCARLGLGPGERAPYTAWQRFFHDSLPDLVTEMAQRYHAWIVLHGKARCRLRPDCPACPLLAICPAGQALANATQSPEVSVSDMRTARSDTPP